jgi:prepilin-type N-terminal cleavage/methylation domain-containing protein
MMKPRGFTLVEMAVVLVIIGLLILTIFPALTSLRSSSQRSLTQSNLQSLMHSTAAYVQANGCLPCPMSPTATGTGFGHVRGDSSISPLPCGACAIPEGVVPYASLGVPASTAHDGWGHWITMRVDPALTINFGITPPTAACTANDLPPNTVTPTCVTLNASQKGLCSMGLSSTNRIIVQTPNGNATPPSQQAAVIFVSHGTTGYGSFFEQAFPPSGNNGQRLPFPSTVPSCSSKGGFSICNADGNNTFVDSPVIYGGIDPYDDVLAFADRNTLVSMFGNGSCQTVW